MKISTCFLSFLAIAFCLGWIVLPACQAQVAVGGFTGLPNMPDQVSGSNMATNGNFAGNLNGWCSPGNPKCNAIPACVTYDGAVTHTADGSGSAKSVNCGSGSVLSLAQVINQVSRHGYYLLSGWAQTALDNNSNPFNGNLVLQNWFSTAGGDAGPNEKFGAFAQADLLDSIQYITLPGNSNGTWIPFATIFAFNDEHWQDASQDATISIHGQTQGYLWLDDISVQQVWPAMHGWVKYPNWRGNLWTDKSPSANMCNRSDMNAQKWQGSTWVQSGPPTPMEICLAVEIDPPIQTPPSTQYALSDLQVLVQVSTTATCASDVIINPTPIAANNSALNYLNGTINTLHLNLDGSSLAADTPYYVCFSLERSSDAAVVATSPPFIIIPRTATERAAMNVWFDLDNSEWKLQPNGTQAHIFRIGTYDELTSSRDGSLSPEFAATSDAPSVVYAAANRYQTAVLGYGTTTDVPTGCGATNSSGVTGNSFVCDYSVSGYNDILPITPNSLDPRGPNDLGNNGTGTNALWPWAEAVGNGGQQLPIPGTGGILSTILLNPMYGYLVNENDTAAGPPFSPSISIGVGSITASTLYLEVGGIAGAATVNSLQTPTETLPSSPLTVDLSSATCAGVNCSISFTMPPCPTLRWIGYTLYASTDNITFHKQFPVVPGQTTLASPVPCGASVDLASIQQSGISPQTTDQTQMAGVRGRPSWIPAADTDEQAYAEYGTRACAEINHLISSLYDGDEPSPDAIYSIANMIINTRGYCPDIPFSYVEPAAIFSRHFRAIEDIVEADPYIVFQNNATNAWMGQNSPFSCTEYDGTNNSTGLVDNCNFSTVSVIMEALANTVYDSRPTCAVNTQWLENPTNAFTYQALYQEDWAAIVTMQNRGSVGGCLWHWEWGGSLGMNDAWNVQGNTQAWYDSKKEVNQLQALQASLVTAPVDSNFLGVGRVLAAHPTAANTVVSDCGSKSAYSNLSSYPDGAIRWNGKIVNGNTYEIDAINLCGTTDIFTFVATAVIPGTVTVVNENRTLTPNAATFSDSFAGYAAHVYQFTLVSSTADFSIGSSPGSPNSASINVGQSVTFNLQITPLGTFTGSVSLSCKISPSPTAAPTCTIPTSATVSSSAAVPFNVVVNTTSAASTELGLSRFPADPISLKWSLLFLASGFLIVSFKQSRRSLVPVLVILQAALWLGCGGSSSNTTSTAGGTPAGTYTATITATSSGLSHTATVTIVVQ